MAEKFIPVKLTLTTDDRQFKTALSGLDKSFGALPRSAKQSFDKIDREMASAAKSGTSHFNNTFNTIRNKAASTGSAVGSILKTALSFTGAGLAVNGLTSILGKVAEIGGAVFDVKERLDRATISFETLLNSREKANQLINSLKQVRNETAGDLTTLTDGARRLLGVGVPLEKTVQILKGLSVGARAFGLTNEELEGIFTAASQVVGKGRLQAEELEQFSERGFGAARKILAEALNISTEKLIELGEQGRIKGLESIEVLAKTLETRFPQAAERAAGTIGSAIGEITQKTTLAAVDALNPAFDRARDGLVKINKELTPERLNLGSSTIAKGLEGTLNVAESTVKALARGEFDIGGAAKAVFDQVSNAISAGVEKGFEKLKNVGGEAISSLKSGVEAAKDQAISAGQSAASSLIGGVKGMLKQNSPSLVMIGLGQQAAESLGDGLSNGKSLQRIADSADKITQTLIDRTSEGMKRWAKQIEKNGGEEFLKAVEAMAARLQADPNQLLNVMAFESRLNPKARNPRGSASGLIQFMSDTAPGLGTSIEKIRTLDAMQQLEYVEKYWKQFKGMLETQEAVYTSVLRGKAINDPDRVLFKAGTKSYRDNRELDADKSGTVTTREATSKVVAQGFTKPTGKSSPIQLPSAVAPKLFTNPFSEGDPGFVLGDSVNLSDIPKEYLIELPKVEKAATTATVAIVTAATAAKTAITATTTTALATTNAAALETTKILETTSNKIADATTDNFSYVIKQAENTKQKVSELGQLIEATFDRALDRLVDGDFKGVGDAVKGFGKQFLAQGIKSVLFGNGGGQSAGGSGGGQSGGSGGILGGLLGGGNSGGGGILGGLLGPGGTSGFSGPLGGKAGGGLLGGIFKGGGVLGKVGSIFGLGGGTSALAGASAATGAGATGAFAGATATAGAAGGAGLLGTIGALATNPFTIAAAAAIGGGFLLYKLFSGRDLKKLRSTIQGEYAVDVKDKNILKEVKILGKQSFGKGWDKRMLETIRLEPAKETIANYAKATGQKGNGKLLSAAEYGDPFNAVNRFERRINGGLLPFATRGYDHIPVLADGGEYMVQSAAVRREGASAFDALNNGQATITPRGNGRSEGSAGTGAMQVQINQLSAVLAGLMATLARFQAVTPGHVLQAGAAERPDVVPNNVLAHQRQNPNFTRQFTQTQFAGQ